MPVARGDGGGSGGSAAHPGVGLAWIIVCRPPSSSLLLTNRTTGESCGISEVLPPVLTETLKPSAVKRSVAACAMVIDLVRKL